MEKKIIARAKKNFRDYQILDEYVAGLSLLGWEIKAIRQNKMAIGEAYVVERDSELFLTKARISSQQKLRFATNPRQEIKLLLNKREIKKIISSARIKKLAIIPLQSFINPRGWAKITIALARKLRKYQLREKIKSQEEKKKITRGDFW